MTVLNLDGFFRPRSVAVIGPAILTPKAIDILIGRLMGAPAHPRVTLVGLSDDIGALSSGAEDRIEHVGGLTSAPDLAVLVCAADKALPIVQHLADLGTRSVLIASHGYDAWPPEVIRAMLEIARPAGLRIIGPGSLGLAVPRIGLDVSLAAGTIARGDVALITRSAAMLNATLAWGRSHRVGFSAVVSLGAKVDVDIGDLLDQFAQDGATKVILIHLDAVSSPGKFLSAARAAARSKPVIVIRSGASRDRRSRGETMLARLVYPDAVYDAAFRRAGLLRVDSLDELFEAIETVTRLKPVVAHRVALIANGSSLATIGADHLASLGGEVPELGEKAIERLKGLVRPGATVENPVTLADGASPETYVATLAALVEDPGTDAIVTVHAPHCLVPSRAVAEAVATFVRDRKKRQSRVKPVISAFLDADPETRSILEEAGIPCHDTPEQAIRSWGHLNRFAEAQDYLMAIPPNFPSDFTPDPAAGAAALANAPVSDGWYGYATVDKLLAAYGLPVPDGWEVETEFEVGIVDDQVFGPVVVATLGSNIMEKMTFRELDLVPLDLNLARGLTDRLSDHSLMAGRPMQDAVRVHLPLMLARLSQMAADLPAIGEVQLDLRVEGNRITVARAQVRRAEVVAGRGGGRLGHPRLAIRPYPKEWERHLTLECGESVFIRPVRPEDESLYPDFLSAVTAEDMRLRFFAPIKDFSHAFLARLTQLDYARAVAFAAIDTDGHIAGVVRLHADPDHKSGEYAILLRSRMKGKGLGRALMQLIIEWAVADGIEVVKGEVFRSNTAMLGMCRELGFDIRSSAEDEAIADVKLEVSKLKPLA
jgi:acetyltransferase